MKVLYFTAQWCGPCKAMKPIIEKFIENNPDMLTRIDVDESLDMISKHKISSIPTFIIFDENNNEVKRHTGAINESSLNELVFG